MSIVAGASPFAVSQHNRMGLLTTRRRTTPAAMPSGALGVWWMDQYSATRPYVPNSASGNNTPAPKNLLSAPRRLFSNASLYVTQNSPVVTDSNFLAADGTNDATTVTWGATQGRVVASTGSVPAGTYTYSVDVCTTDASTVNVIIGGGASPPTKSVTPSWSTISATFVHAGGSPNLFIISAVNTSTPANLAIINARLHAGSADLGVDALDGTLMLGGSAYNNQPAISGGAFDLSSAGFGLIQVPTSATLSGAFTAICVAQRVAAVPLDYSAFLCKVQDGQAWGALLSGAYFSPTGINGAAPGCNIAGSDRIKASASQQPSAGLYNPATGTYEVFSNRYDGANIDAFINGVKLVTTAPGALSYSVADFSFGRFGSTTKYAIKAVALYARKLTDAEYSQAVTALMARVGSVNPEAKFMLAEGHSIVYGQGATLGDGYVSLFGANAVSLLGYNRGVQSATLSGNGGNSLYGRQALDNTMLPLNKNGKMFIYYCDIGRNDLPTYSGGAAQFAADIAVFAGLQKAAGWDKFALATMLPSTLSGFNALRNVYNAIITTPGWAAANNVDLIVDLGANTDMGPDAAASDVSKYSDGTHPTQAGYVFLEPTLRAAINSL